MTFHEWLKERGHWDGALPLNYTMTTEKIEWLFTEYQKEGYDND